MSDDEPVDTDPDPWRCTANRSDGARCRSRRLDEGWPTDDLGPLPTVCYTHLQPDIQARLYELTGDEDLDQLVHHLTARPLIPYCWGLPLPRRPIVDLVDLYDWQRHRCAVCGTGTRWGELLVDHCHRTGWVRGWLCHICNKVEGRPLTSRADIIRYRWIPPAVLCNLLGVDYIGPKWEPDPTNLAAGPAHYIGPRTLTEAIQSRTWLDEIPPNPIGPAAKQLVR